MFSIDDKAYNGEIFKVVAAMFFQGSLFLYVRFPDFPSCKLQSFFDGHGDGFSLIEDNNRPT